MKSNFPAILFQLIVFICTGAYECWAGKTADNTARIQAPFLRTGIIVDGNLSEWKDISGASVNQKYNLETGNLSGDDDLSAVFFFAWDNENLYFAARIRDNQLLRSHKGPDIWKDDCIELFMDPKYDGLKWGDPSDFQIGFAPAADGHSAESWAWFQNVNPGSNIKFVTVRTRSGYDIEASIKWKFLNVQPRDGMVLGVSPAFHDVDNDSTPEAKLNWYFNKGIFGMLGRLILVKNQGPDQDGGIQNLMTEKDVRSVTPQDYYESIPAQRKDFYPRWLSREQAYFTVTGAEGDENEALICEDGSSEPFKRGFCIMPFIFSDGKLLGRNTGTFFQSLEEDCLPIPSVDWDLRQGVHVNVRLFVTGEKNNSTAVYIYKIKNNTGRNLSEKFFLAFLPMQIYPSWQGGGGLSPIKDAVISDNVVEINKKYKILLLDKPDFSSTRDGQFKTGKDFDGDIIQTLADGVISGEKTVSEPNGFASAGIGYDLSLQPAPGTEREIIVVIPLNGQKPEPGLTADAIHVKLEQNKMFWESKLKNFRIDIPEKKITDTLKASILYNIVTRDGPGYQPGSRSYDKTWMRDGGIAANAMLETGFTDEVGDFIRWIAGFQFKNGEIPPVLDTKAPDPLWEEKQNGLIEYDSQGEFIWIISQYYQYTKDSGLLKAMFPKVIDALGYLADLRKQRLTDEFKSSDPEKKRFYGILPQSTSHEGYSHSYSFWDDFWALRGWKEAGRMAGLLGKKELVKSYSDEYEGLKKALLESIDLTARWKKINFIPGSADLGDFDATSTAIAIIYCDELQNLPKEKLKNTFDRYYSDLRNRMKKNAEYRYTPYEIRSAAAFLRMGQKQRCLDLIRFILHDQRPQGFQMMAEAVDSDPRKADYFGDMPHTWVGSEYINVVRSLFVYETGEILVLGAGIDEKWLDAKDGVSAENLPTVFGKVGFTEKKEGDSLKIRISGDASPAGGFVFHSPYLDKKVRSVLINGSEKKGFTGNEVSFDKLPVEIELRY